MNSHLSVQPITRLDQAALPDKSGHGLAQR